jgi:hypothetical protein
MKIIYRLCTRMGLLSGFIFLFSGCMKDKITKTYQVSTPIYQVLSEYRKAIKSQPATTLTAPGKMSVIGKYIFLSETGKGIHVVDNSNPASPRNISFINIPGNVDMAIKGNTLYADAYGDLVTFDISDPTQVLTKNFSPNVFPDRSIYYWNVPSGGGFNPDSVKVIIGWTYRDTTVDYNPDVNPVFYSGGCANCMSIAATMATAAAPPGTIATNGSTARFSIINNYLYTIVFNSLSAFDISQPYNPSLAGSVQINSQVETIYPFKDRLFVGTSNGVYMYNIQQTPAAPALIGEFVHLRSCDPVIADNEYAYITLNDGSACQGFSNELQIVDIKDMSNPVLIKTYQLKHPEGLSKDGDHLFICDGDAGLKVFNTSDLSNLQLIRQLTDATVSDVIAINGIAIVIGTDGIYEYDYSNLSDIHLISKL